MAFHTLHEHARLMRKLGIFLAAELAKLFAGKGLNFFIFLADSRIVHAQLMLSGERGEGLITNYPFGYAQGRLPLGLRIEDSAGGFAADR